MAQQKPERWAGRLGVILAVAGSAVGLGNFLRFPTQAAQHGGGAFLIPYFCALLLLGLPLMWMEWGFGKLGGASGRHSLPGIYDALIGRRWAKYLGVLGLYVPFVVVVYYTYIESWTLGYSILSLTGRFHGVDSREAMGGILSSYLGIDSGTLALPVLGLAFLVVTIAFNFYVIYRGVSAGIERLSRIAMPLLFLMAIVLVVRVLTLPGAAAGLDFLWKPQFAALNDPKIWLAAAGQIFFTLSLGLGAIITYSSYLRPQDDVALSGLTSASLNTFAEVVLGASLAIPAAVVFFGAAQTHTIAQGGSFSLGFMAMPVIFQHIAGGPFFSALWFLLLFFAGLTSSVSLLQPIVAFLQDELGWSRRKATGVTLGMTVAYLIPVVLLMKQGFLDEMDFWAGNILLAVAALVEVLLFVGVIGMRRGWEAITSGAAIRLPRAYRFILAWVTPAYLLVMLGWWLWQDALPKLTLKGLPPAQQAYTLLARAVLVAVLLGMMWLVRHAWRGRAAATTTPVRKEESYVG